MGQHGCLSIARAMRREERGFLTVEEGEADVLVAGRWPARSRPSGPPWQQPNAGAKGARNRASESDFELVKVKW